MRRRAPRFELVGGAVCLDFVNTMDDRSSDNPKELLKDYVDLARFAEDTGILPTNHVDRLFSLSQRAPQEAQKVLKAAVEFREALFQVFEAIVGKKTIPAGALYQVNSFIQEAAQHASLAPVKGGFAWRFEGGPDNLDAPLWGIARSVAELLTSDKLKFLHTCASPTCEWFFVDMSKNHQRRWCDMKQCGNRAKVRRFYKRSRR